MTLRIGILIFDGAEELDFVGPYEERDRQIGRFASEALPLLAGLRKTPS